VISQHSLLQSVCKHCEFRASGNVVPAVATGWCVAVVHQNGVLYWRGRGELCVAVQAELFNDIGSTVVCTNYGNEAHTIKCIYKWQELFAQDWLYLWFDKRIRADDQVARMWSVFLRRFSTVRSNPLAASGELGDFSHMTVWTVLRKRLSFRPYKFQPL
jgi:hypothetical protein